MNSLPPPRPFSLASPSQSWPRRPWTPFAFALERVLGLTELDRMYAEAVGTPVVDDFPERALEHLGITWRVHGAGADAIPSSGPVVLVSNHPFGAVDGLLVLAIARSVRRDVRLLGNYLLNRIPELQPILLSVDPFGGAGAPTMNSRAMRRAIDWVKRGGALVVFPAGEVSSVAASEGRLVDPAWRAGAAKIVRQTGAPVVPIYVGGRNSRLFEIGGRVHPVMRTALLPRELLRRRNSTVDMVVGRPIPLGAADPAGDTEQTLARLRAHTYALERALDRPMERPPASPIAAPADQETMAAEVSALPDRRLLASHGALRAYHASAREIPAVLHEIGRLREATFRAVGEGTGGSLDLDRFDAGYQHLFLWHTERHEVVGAYRMGLTDVLARRDGPKALYSHTLFRYGRAFLRKLGPSIELGRSFVRAEHQREFAPLFLLWQAIGQFVARHPRYRRLFGPVTISREYSEASRDLLVDALDQAATESPLTRLVRPRRAYVRSGATDRASATLDLDAVHALLSAIEPDGRGLPVLLRQYLKLNGAPLACSVDPKFANAIDVMVVVTLDDVERPVLTRYMGPDGVAAFLTAPHREPAAPRRRLPVPVGVLA